MSDYLEAVSKECVVCRYTVALPVDRRPLVPPDMMVVDMPYEVCETCGRSMLFNYRSVEIPEAELVA